MARLNDRETRFYHLSTGGYPFVSSARARCRFDAGVVLLLISCLKELGAISYYTLLLKSVKHHFAQKALRPRIVFSAYAMVQACIQGLVWMFCLRGVRGGWLLGRSGRSPRDPTSHPACSGPSLKYLERRYIPGIAVSACDATCSGATVCK